MKQKQITNYIPNNKPTKQVYIGEPFPKQWLKQHQIKPKWRYPIITSKKS